MSVREFEELKALYGNETYEKIRSSRILMIGSGGIGCELLKCLALFGFQNIDIIDLDTIEVSNLNRQFLFRKAHVGQSKSKVAAETVMKFNDHLNIKAHHGNVKDDQFDIEYFKQFDVILNGLDNLDARNYVNRMSLIVKYLKLNLVHKVI